MIFKSNLRHNEKNYYDSLFFLLLIIMLVPSFPSKFGNSLIPSTFVLIISLGVVFTDLERIVVSRKLALFWLFLYVVMLLTALFSDETISLEDLTELLIPFSTMLFSFWISTKFKFVNITSLNLFLNRFLFFSFISSLCLFFVATMEFSLIYVDWLYELYKPFEKYEDVTRAVTFFSYPYYSTFYNLMLLALIVPLAIHKPGVISIVCVFLLIAVNLMTQSSTGLLSLLIYLIFMFYFSNKKFLNNFFKLTVLIVPLMFFIIYAEGLLTYLIERHDLYSLRVIRKVVFSPQDSGSLNTRLEQIYFSLDATAAKGYLIGGGWGRELFLESFLAYSLYKFGLFFTLFLVFLWIERLLSLYKSYKFFKHRNNLMFLLSKSLISFFVVLPLLSSSSFLFFRHKVTLLFVVILAVSFLLERNRKSIGYGFDEFKCNKNGNN